MKNRVKYIVIILFIIMLVFVITNSFISAKNEKTERKKLESDKVARKTNYSIKRENNKYTLKSNKLGDKTLNDIYYDSLNVYLYYEDEANATLLKYNIEEKTVIVLFENDESIKGGLKRLGKYFILGNTIYDKFFKEVKTYDVNDGEFLFPNLKKVLLKENDTIYLKNTENSELTELLKDSENETYTPLGVKNDGKYYLIEKSEADKKSILIYDKKNELINSFDKKKDTNTYTLLDDIPYLLETDDDNYNIYDVKEKTEVLNSNDKDLENYYFDNTTYVASDKDKNIKLIDYTTEEERVLLDSTATKNKKTARKFILADDKYSLLLVLNDTNKEFYIFYL